eukprot:m.92924 g.92924  ORF g.92924 m.92924 type:complete len:83 (+) comp16526_c0_seq4:2067-2315(+)
MRFLYASSLLVESESSCRHSMGQIEFTAIVCFNKSCELRLGTAAWSTVCRRFGEGLLELGLCIWQLRLQVGRQHPCYSGVNA